MKNDATAGGLAECLLRVASIQREAVDRLAIHQVVSTLSAALTPQRLLKTVVKRLGFHSLKWHREPSHAAVPALLCTQEGEWCVLRGQNGHGDWVIERWSLDSKRWEEEQRKRLDGYQVATITFFSERDRDQGRVASLIKREFFSNKKLLVATIVGGAVINLTALAASLYTMQVYDRVVPTAATQTLLVLTIGVLVAVVYEFIGKRIRSRIYETMVDDVDQTLSHSIYRRFLDIRLDQLPQSVGSLASQMRGYETVRGFLSAATQHVMVDAPFVLLFVLVIFSIAGWLALIPLTFFLISLGVGLYYRKRVNELAQAANYATNYRTGLLVESVEGAETIKSGQGGWRMLSRWMATTNEARDYELKMRNISEHSQYLVASAQQLSYICIVASGALLISQGGLTMGGLIATSILSGRILTPVAAIPNVLVQAAHCKAALEGLEKLWSLEGDHHGYSQPIVMENISGHYRFDNVEVEYNENKALQVPSLNIEAGQKVAVLGPVGAGKTTLLRLLTGMHKPNQGSVFIDDVDLAQVSKPSLAENMAYVQQDGRLFSGTLRDNLVLGLLDPGDEAIFAAARATGLLVHVITPHPKGLDQPIFEGGTGLSGGQRQLVHLTRAFLRKPKIWLLDEPSASMDRRLEMQVIEALKSELKSTDTMVLVTHKVELLSLAERVIVVADHRIIMDGARDQVMQKLSTSPKEARKVS